MITNNVYTQKFGVTSNNKKSKQKIGYQYPSKNKFGYTAPLII